MLYMYMCTCTHASNQPSFSLGCVQFLCMKVLVHIHVHILTHTVHAPFVSCEYKWVSTVDFFDHNRLVYIPTTAK